MLYTFKARGIEFPKDFKAYAEKRLDKLEKLVALDEAVLTLTQVRDTYRLEVTLPCNGHIIRGEVQDQDANACVDLVSEKLEKQIRKYRSRLTNKKGGESVRDAAPAVTDEVAEPEAPVRTKTYTTKPMTAEEAIMQLELLGHSFYVYLDSETQQTHVVYRRADGKYGLMMPE